MEKRATRDLLFNMKIQEQIEKFILNQPESKRNDMDRLHKLISEATEEPKLWFDDGKNDENKTISNPTIGYGIQTIKYANGKTKEFFRIGMSANKSGISVYILGIGDKTFLAKTYGKKLGNAKVTGYCIRFRSLNAVDINVLDQAIRYGFSIRHES